MDTPITPRSHNFISTIDFMALDNDQEEKCTPDQVEGFDMDMKNAGLPTLDEIDQTCYLLREMLTLDHQDRDIFIRDVKKGTR